MRILRLLVAVAALGALAIVVTGGGAASAKPAAKHGSVIKMEKKGKDLFFTAPKTVEAGTNLKIKNATNPKQVGPHTFSLVAPKVLPTNEEADQGLREEAQGHLRRRRQVARRRRADRSDR